MPHGQNFYILWRSISFSVCLLVLIWPSPPSFDTANYFFFKKIISSWCLSTLFTLLNVDWCLLFFRLPNQWRAGGRSTAYTALKELKWGRGKYGKCYHWSGEDLMENKNWYLFISKNTATEKLRECLIKLLNYPISKQLFLETNMAEIFF